MKRLLALSLIAVSAFSSAATFNLSGGAITITDNATQTSNASFAGMAGAITSLDSVTLRGVNHTWVGDLTVRLTYGGQMFTLFHRPKGTSTSTAGSSNNFVAADLLFTSSATTTIDSLATAVSTFNIPSGTYRAAHQTVENQTTTSANNTVLANHGVFNGLDPNGTWSLTVTDSASGDIGNITSWAAEGTYTAVPEPATMAALGLGVAAMLRRRSKKS